MLADFTITVHEARKPMAVRIKVHESTAALRMASAKYNQRTELERGADFSETLGICHRFHMMNDPLVAIVRLAPPELGVGIVTHELTHVAVWMWEIQNKFKHIPLVCQDDEWFCWLVGELASKTVDKMYEKGIYPLVRMPG